MKGATWRIRIISVGIIAIALVFVAKLYLVQVVNGSQYREDAERQYVRPGQALFDRGSIYFSYRDGGVYSAATVKSGFQLIMNPKLIKDASSTYESLNLLYPLNREEFMAKAEKKNDPYEELAKRVDEVAGQKMSELKLPGIQVVREKWRYYPGNKLGAQTLGFVGFKGDQLVGRYGLESFYENTLKRESDKKFVNFFAEIFSNIEEKVINQGDLEGDVVTTIEPSVQQLLEKYVNQVQTQYQSEMTAGIVMDPKTGEIIAMTSSPSFDPNTYQNEKNIRVYSNPLVENVYEMGSIVKPLSMAAGLDTGAVKARTTVRDPGYITLDGKKIQDHDRIDHGIVDMQEVLNQSLNVGITFVMQQMGRDVFTSYMKAFGLAEQSGIDVPNEGRNLVKNLDTNRDIEHATAAYGQGIALTPITVIRALSALGNGGYLPTPHVVKKIDYRLGFSKETEIKEGRRVIKKETSEEISRMLTELVDRALKNGQMRMLHYSIAAKTGTAQIPEPGGGYYEDRTLHSFFGYFPSYNPRFIILLMTIHPKDAKFASETLTGPFFDIAKFLIHYYEIPPDR